MALLGKGRPWCSGGYKCACDLALPSVFCDPDNLCVLARCAPPFRLLHLPVRVLPVLLLGPTSSGAEWEGPAPQRPGLGGPAQAAPPLRSGASWAFSEAPCFLCAGRLPHWLVLPWPGSLVSGLRLPGLCPQHPAPSDGAQRQVELQVAPPFPREGGGAQAGGAGPRRGARERSQLLWAV